MYQNIGTYRTPYYSFEAHANDPHVMMPDSYLYYMGAFRVP